MKIRAHWIIWAACVGVAITGCQPNDKHPPQPQQPPQVQVLTAPQPAPQPPQPSSPDRSKMSDPVMKVYAVPPGYQEMLADELQRLLIVGDQPLGKVRQMPGDQLMVLAPEPIHGGVVTLLEALRQAPPPATPQHQDVEARYWFVLAQQGDGADGPGLAPIQEVLAQLETKQGPMRFSLLDQLVVRGSDGRESQVHSRYARVVQRLFPGSAQQTLGNLSISVHNRSLLDTEIHIRAGQTLVLGQVGYEDPDAGRRSDLVLRADGDPSPTPQAAPILLVIARFEQQSP